VVSALALAKAHGFGSIAFPLIGAGTGGFSPESTLRIMQTALAQAAAPLQVRIVVYASASS